MEDGSVSELLLSNYEDMSSVSQDAHQRQTGGHVPVTPVMGRQRQDRFYWSVSLSNQKSPVSRTNEKACLKHQVGINEKRPLMKTSGLYTCVDTCALRPTHINIHIQRDIIYITDLSHSRSQHFLLLPCNCQIQIISFSRTFASLGASF